MKSPTIACMPRCPGSTTSPDWPEVTPAAPREVHGKLSPPGRGPDRFPTPVMGGQASHLECFKCQNLFIFLCWDNLRSFSR